jgi:hypothetical protein
VVYCNDYSCRITFFAFDNFAIRPHPKHAKEFVPYEYSLSTVLENIENLDLQADDKDKDKKKRLLKHIVKAILSYHILPGKFDGHALAGNSTFATSLLASDGSFSEQARRIKVLGPFLHSRGGIINLYSKIKRTNIPAQNGILRVFGYLYFINLISRYYTRHQFPPHSSIFHS